MDINEENHSAIITHKNKKYLKGALLGKGGYAECYTVTDVDTDESHALKIVPKSRLLSKSSQEKIKREIKIHKSLQHENIVEFHGYFEDEENVYVLLELCHSKSLMEMFMEQKMLTEAQVRYFLRQTALGCKYLHDRKIIHRDLKLNNLLLNRDMIVKIGDFGFSTRIEFDGERKRSVCGTLCYSAPEILNKNGHSFGVDSWSLGVIVYTLLTGRPPFMNNDHEALRELIRSNKYKLPDTGISESARNLIRALLDPDPSKRPTMDQVLQDEFITKGMMLVSVKFPEIPCHSTPVADLGGKFKHLNLDKLNNKSNIRPGKLEQQVPDINVKNKTGLFRMFEDLMSLESSQIVHRMSEDRGLREENYEPIYWLRTWLHWSRYGLLYQFSTNSVGYKFNDSTWITKVANDEQRIRYTDENLSQHFYTMESFPSHLDKKMTLFRSSQQLLESFRKAGESLSAGENLTSVPVVDLCQRSQRVHYFYLSDGTLQINFSRIHDKLVVCPGRRVIVYLDAAGSTTVTSYSHIKKNGCTRILADRLRYARKLVKVIMDA